MPVLNLVTVPNPVLRMKSKPIARVDKEFQTIVQEMFRLMYDSKGVGLAANQVGIPVRLFVCNPSGKPNEGNEMVFINPVISKQKGVEEADEGCLSLPGVTASVKRSKSLWVNAYDHTGNEINTEYTGFIARIIQHESDHLDGVLFVDRISEESLNSIAYSIDTIAQDYLSRQRTGSLESDERAMEIAAKWEKQYC